MPRMVWRIDVFLWGVQWQEMCKGGDHYIGAQLRCNSNWWSAAAWPDGWPDLGQ